MRRSLGKGLSQLIAEQDDAAPREANTGDIVPNQRQPRTHFDEASLEELASSIREFGVLQPLIVRPLAEGRFELVAGERRLRAARLAGLDSVPVVLRSADNQNSLEIALVENLQREDIGALECAKAYRKLMDEFRLTQDQVADKVGKSRVVIANAVRLLRLPKRVQAGLEGGKITEGHARALLAFESEAEQLAMYERIVARGLTVRDVEQAAKPKRTAPKTGKPSNVEDPNLRALQEALSVYLGAPALITRGGSGGKLTIEFFSDSDLERILEVLGISL